jgi:cyclase
MLKKRIIPVVLFRNGNVVQSKNFNTYKNLGNPVVAINRFSEWGADEICFLDISDDKGWNVGRNDLKEKGQKSFLEVLQEISKVAYMPLTCGGGIKSMQDIDDRIRFGADKISINSLFFNEPSVPKQAATEYGSQCVVASIDVVFDGRSYVVYVDGGKTNTGIFLEDWVKKVESLGAGEILLNSIDRDGSKTGYDTKLIEIALGVSSVPVIACGGAGDWADFEIALKMENLGAVAAANIFHHKDQSVYHAHQYLIERNIPVRPPSLINTNFLER